MGNICTDTCEKQKDLQTIDTYKNSTEWEARLGKHCSVLLVYGHSKYHKGDSLVVMTETKALDNSDAIKDFAVDPKKAVQQIRTFNEAFYSPSVNKNSPYNKLLICVMPHYQTQQFDQYLKIFQTNLNRVLHQSKDIVIQFTHTLDGIAAMPNQLLICELFKQLKKRKEETRVHLIGADKKMMTMYKWELIKTQECQIEHMNDLHYSP